MLLLANLVQQPVRPHLRAVRDDEVAARLAGIHVARTQVLAFVVSAACAGPRRRRCSRCSRRACRPGAFSLTLSLFLLLADRDRRPGQPGRRGVGRASCWSLLPDLTHSITDSLDVSRRRLAQRLEGNLPLAIFGLTLIVVMLAAPGGIQGLPRRIGTQPTQAAA